MDRLSAVFIYSASRSRRFSCKQAVFVRAEIKSASVFPWQPAQWRVVENIIWTGAIVPARTAVIMLAAFCLTVGPIRLCRPSGGGAALALCA